MASLQTGYFEKGDEKTKVHIVRGIRPKCGEEIGEGFEFRFLSHGIALDHIDCERCLAFAWLGAEAPVTKEEAPVAAESVVKAKAVVRPVKRK